MLACVTFNVGMRGIEYVTCFAGKEISEEEGVMSLIPSSTIYAAEAAWTSSSERSK